MELQDIKEGDRIELYDRDVERWVAGTVESKSQVGDSGFIVVTTDEFYEGLPLKLGMPADALEEFARWA